MTDTDPTVQPIVDAPGIRVHPADSNGNNRIEFLAYPDAAKVVRVPEDLAKRLADLMLHRMDLEAAGEFLDEFDRHCPDTPNSGPTAMCTAIWHAALNSVMKCFGTSNARRKLNPDIVFGANGPDRETFDWLRNLRNKNVAHDDNDWMQASPIAFIAQPGTEPKVIDVLCSVFQMVATSTSNAANLRMVVIRSLEWVHKAFDQEHESVLGELRSRDYLSLLALPELSGAWPTNNSIGQTR